VARSANEVVVIIGGSSGIGRECARLFAKQGADTVLMARGRDRLDAVVAEILASGGQAHAVAADVSNHQDVRQAAEQIAAQHGRVDVLLYAAGAFYLSPVETMDIEAAKRLMEVNYWGAVSAAQAFLPLLRQGQGKTIVLLSSLSVPCTPPFFTAYAATKHALRGLALSLRQEVRPEGIRVLLASPGPVDTPLIEQHLHRDMYRLPPGIPVLQPEIAARQIVKAVRQKKRGEVVVPRRMSLAARLAYSYPSLVEWYYRLSVPGWSRSVLDQVSKQRLDSGVVSTPLVSPRSPVRTSEPEE
jgi:NAD(P)-dependent dehydrogenase (short-subunit alcohol dehydrogenase family)